MKYLNFIFENHEIRDFIHKQNNILEEQLNRILSNDVKLYDYVLSNLNKFIHEDNLDLTYDRIKTFALKETLDLLYTSSSHANEHK